MKYRVLSIWLVIFCSVTSQAQNADYPTATPTDQPNVVISPFDSSRRLDVEGLKPGSLAEDPEAKKIFRVPLSNPTNRYYEEHLGGSKPKSTSPPPIPPQTKDEVIPPPSINNTPPPTPQPKPSPKGPNAPSWVPESGQLPKDLVRFLHAFNRSSMTNSADALLSYYAPTIEKYFGRTNLGHSDIRTDRAAYIKKFPQRKYIIDGAPVLLAKNGNTYEVMTRVRYSVEGNGRSLSGAVANYMKIRRGSSRYEIIGVNEAKAKAAPRKIQQQDQERTQTQNSVNPNSPRTSIYSRFEIDQLSLFVDAFAAAGELNDPSAMIEFMHPNTTTYYSLKSPTTTDLRRDRDDYIKKWPSRRYWLAEQPIVKPLSNGKWDVVTKMGYEVRNGSRNLKGVAASVMRIAHTSAGLKVSSIRETR